MTVLIGPILGIIGLLMALASRRPAFIAVTGVMLVLNVVFAAMTWALK